MKKVLLIVIVVIISAFGLSFAGCSGAGPTQRLLSDSSPWLSSAPFVETSTYTVTRNNVDKTVADTGSYIVSVEKFINTNINVGENKLDNFSGYVATSDLKMNNGDSEHSVVAFSTTIALDASYTKFSYANGTGKEIIALNSPKKYNYKIVLNGDVVEKESSIKHKKFDAAPYIDKTMLYLVARCIPNSVASFGFKVLSPDLNKALDVTMKRPTVLEDIVLDGAPIACKVFSASENITFPGVGTAYKCYVASKRIDGTKMIADDVILTTANKSAVMKIVENNVEYVLTSIVSNKI